MLVARFFKLLVEHGYSRYTYGWIGGDTFPEICFLEYGFYNSEVEKLFHSFMNSSPRISIDDLEAELSIIETEEKSIITINRPSTIKQLKKLDSEPFILIGGAKDLKPLNIRGCNATAKVSQLSIKRAKKCFRDISIAATYINPTDEEIIVCQRINTIIHDIIDSTVHGLGLYELESSMSQYNELENSVTIFGIYSLKRKTVSLSTIREAVIKSLREFTLANHEKELESYINAFVNTETWHYFPVDYFKYSGIIASRAQIAKVLTRNNIEKIISKLHIDVVETKDSHWRKL